MSNPNGRSRANLLEQGARSDAGGGGAPPPSGGSRRSAWIVGGCLVALVLAGMALVAVFVVLPILAVGGLMATEGGREMAQAAWDASHAPGTAELVDAGCQSASVMDLGRVVGAMDKLGVDMGDDDSALDAMFGVPFVTCNLGFVPPAELDCAAVARTYAAAVPDAPPLFHVTVNTVAGSPLGCEGLHDHEGTFVGDLATVLEEP